jgi:hypothetical protein
MPVPQTTFPRNQQNNVSQNDISPNDPNLG